MKHIHPFNDQRALDIMRENAKKERAVGTIVTAQGQSLRVVKRPDGAFSVHCEALGIHANYFDSATIRGQGSLRNRPLIREAVSLATKQLTAVK